MKQGLRHRDLLLVERLHRVLDLLDGVEFEALLVDRVDELVHPVEEHLDVLLDLLVRQQILEVTVRVVALSALLAVHAEARCVALS